MADFVDISEMKRYKEMLEELLDIEEGLTEWEVDFLESLANWEGSFTVKQVGKLEKMHERIM